MTRQELAATPPVIVVTQGMTLAQAIEAQERPVEGKCFWLGGHCDNDAEPGGWLCPVHREWRPNVPTGILRRDIDAIDDLDDDAFRKIVAKRVGTATGNRLIWKMLCHPVLLERTEGCLEELAEELRQAIASRALPTTHHKAKLLSLVNHRLEQVSAATARVTGHASTMNEEVGVMKALARRLALAIDAHRLECVRLDLSPEPHDVALWEVLDALTLPANGRDRGPTLAEQIAAGHWRHPETGGAR